MLVLECPAMSTETDPAAVADAASAASATAAATAADDAGAFDVHSAAAATADDGAAAADAGADGGKKEGEAADAGIYGAPETYADFTMPEGVTLDADLLAEFTPVLKELNLSQASAQKVLDFAPKLLSQAVEGIKAQLADEARSWHDAARGDKEIGGAKMAETLAVANKAFAKFGTPELKAFLASRGLNAHPELIRAFYRAGKAISEDRFVAGGASVGRPRAFYDNSRMN